MATNVRVTDTDWDRLRAHCARSFRSWSGNETGVIALLGESVTAKSQDLLVAELKLPAPGDIKVSTSGSLVFDAVYIRRAHVAMRQRRLAGLLFIHTHPHQDTLAAFSPYDNAEEPELVANLREIEPQTTVASIVLSKQTQCGRCYCGDGASVPMGSVYIVGETLRELSLAGGHPPPPPSPAAVFDRGRALTGDGALARLARMTVGIVGASGTGSPMVEFLVRAGCGRVVLIDGDVVKDVNLNRMLHASAWDAETRQAKVEVVRREVTWKGLGTEVQSIKGSILDGGVLAELKTCDIVFGCVDRALPRELLCRFSHQYLLPYLDLGTEIGGTEGDGIGSVDVRVSYVTPDRPCLLCMGVVNSRQLGFEGLSREERRRRLALGYSDDLVMTQPAVLDLNARAASAAMLWLRHLLQPFMVTPMPLAIYENVITLTMRGITNRRVASGTCKICEANRHRGAGDCGPPLGFDAETAASLMDD
jgi:hypothetical protein